MSAVPSQRRVKVRGVTALQTLKALAKASSIKEASMSGEQFKTLFIKAMQWITVCSLQVLQSKCRCVDNIPPVCNIIVIPLQVSFESLIVADVWDTTARLLHGINRGQVKRACLLQPELPLELLQCFRWGHDCLQSALLENIYVAVTLQVLLESKIQIREEFKQNNKLHCTISKADD